MAKRNPQRRKLIRLQNAHGKKLGRAYFERDNKPKKSDDRFKLRA